LPGSRVLAIVCIPLSWEKSAFCAPCI
jgi:hypothetical protein